MGSPSRDELKRGFIRFLREFRDEKGSRKYEEMILRLIDERKRSLVVDYKDLFADLDSRPIAKHLLKNPEECIEAGSSALKDLVKELSLDYISEDAETYLKKPFHLRFCNLPMKISIRDIPKFTFGKFISLEGIVTRISDVYDRLYEAVYSCPSCGNVVILPLTESDRAPKMRMQCPKCKSSMELDVERSEFMNWQYIRIQERPEDLPPGAMPKYIDAVLLDDLVDEVKPGDRVKASAIIRIRPGRSSDVLFGPLFRRYLEINYIEASSKAYEKVEISPEDEAKIRELSEDPDIEDKIVRSIAPSIYGVNTIKRAIALTMFGGNEKVLADGTRVRGEINLLLLGDPGVAKCVTGETLVLSDGDFVPISEIVSQLERNHSADPMEDGFVWRASIDVRSLGKDLHIRKTESKAIAKRRHKGVVFKIITKSGLEIRVTPTHPILTLREEGLSFLESREIHPGAFIATVRNCEGKGDPIPRELASLIGLLYYATFKKTKEGAPTAEVRVCREKLNEVKRLLSRIKGIKVRYISEEGRISLVLGQKLVDLLGRDFYKLIKQRSSRDLPSLERMNSREVAEAVIEGMLYVDNRGKKPRRTIFAFNLASALKIRALLLSLGYVPRISKTKRGFRIWLLRKGRVSKDVVPCVGPILVRVLERYNIDPKLLGVPKRKMGSYSRGEAPVPRALLRKAMELIPDDTGDVEVSLLRTLSSSDIFWDEVVGVEQEEFDGWVYDVEVPDSYNFVANGLIVHNSQLLKYVAQVAPRGLYTTGKGSTAAGLTAAVVRDASTGGWTLEAGALVLADRGIACIDEFDKMSDEDRKAIHEAMEQQTISIAKAGIVATLNARTTIIAAANPKKGRYDPFSSVAENINLPPTILSRFDLIYIIRDRPEEENDERIASHIIETRRGYNPEAEPEIPPDLLRKYIAYARQKVRPVLTKEAAGEIRKFYVEMRRLSREKEEESEVPELAPIPITPRQLEALIRLSEARARLHLREEVLVEDAKAAVELMKAMLRDVGYDVTTGTYDISALMTGTFVSASRRREAIVRILAELEKKYKSEEGVPRSELIAETAKRLGYIGKEVIIDRDISALISEGRIYRPREGYVRLVPRGMEE